MNKFNCEILADSKNPQGDRITTMKITFPRFILAEMNTHRMFSRNSASSRAIPFKKMVKMVEEDPFIPIAWQKDHKGMQGTEYFTDESQIKSKINCWLNARDHTLRSAKYLNSDLVVHKMGDETFISFNQTDEDSIEQLMAEKRLENTKVTKQLCNRLLEPFMWHTVIVTATEWENFFNLRCPQYQMDKLDPIFKSKKDCEKYYSEKGDNIGMTQLDWLMLNKSQAEIHIQAIAELMYDALNESTPKELKAGEWHIPFGDNMNDDYLRIELEPHVQTDVFDLEDFPEDLIKLKIKIATARCARISYETLGDEGKINYRADVRLHDQLIGPPFHASPFEHCAKAMDEDEYELYSKGKLSRGVLYIWPTSDTQGWCRNYRGFIQYRDLIENN